MKLTKEQLYGFTGSVLISLILILLLSVLFLRTEIRAEESGIPVNFGTVDWAFGAEEPAELSNNPEIGEPTPEIIPEPVPPTPNPAVITQNTEQTAAVDAAKEKERKAEQARKEAEKRRLEQEKREKELINQTMANAFGKGNSSSTSEGTAASGSGNQGSPQGNAPTGSYAGVGGSGTFDLQGRGLSGSNTLITPSQESIVQEGTIVVEITVNPQGNVIQATVRLRGTNIDDIRMRKSAIDAAKKNKFTIMNGTNNQTGTITYKYTLK
ncbi:MAG: TonB family protein [Candidatus Symbiothrix sp.]|jgi:TonB family protein|nr:TonB family protein [Candidatus Symbiothrix sp.]